MGDDPIDDTFVGSTDGVLKMWKFVFDYNHQTSTTMLITMTDRVKPMISTVDWTFKHCVRFVMKWGSELFSTL